MKNIEIEFKNYLENQLNDDRNKNLIYDEFISFLLSERDVEQLFKIPANTLRKSRTTGELWGISAPKFYKFGRKTVRYKLGEILNWLDNIEELNNTAQITFQY